MQFDKNDLLVIKQQKAGLDDDINSVERIINYYTNEPDKLDENVANELLTYFSSLAGNITTCIDYLEEILGK